MRKSKLITLFTVAMMIMPSMSFAFASGDFVISTEESTYEAGDAVKFMGNATADANITIEISFNFTSARILSVNTTADEDGEFSHTMMLSESALAGVYNVTALTSNLTAEIDFTVIASTPEEEPDDTDDAKSAGDGDLGNAIARARVYLTKTEAMLESLAEEYAENEVVMGYIERANKTWAEAESYLDDAEDALGDSDNSTAARNLAAAHNIMGRLKGLINSVIKEHKNAQVDKFIEQAESRFNGLEDKIERLREQLSASESEGIKNALKNAAKNMNKFRERLGNESADDLLDDLDDAVNDVDEEIRKIGGKEVGNTLRQMNQVEARLRVLKASRERLTRKYENISEVNDEFDEAEGILEDMMGEMEKGNVNNTKALVNQAKELTKSIQKQNTKALKAMAKSSKGNSRP